MTAESARKRCKGAGLCRTAEGDCDRCLHLNSQFEEGQKWKSAKCAGESLGSKGFASDAGRPMERSAAIS